MRQTVDQPAIIHDLAWVSVRCFLHACYHFCIVIVYVELHSLTRTRLCSPLERKAANAGEKLAAAVKECEGLRDEVLAGVGREQAVRAF